MARFTLLAAAIASAVAVAPEGWVRGERAAADTPVSYVVALSWRPEGTAAVKAIVDDVSNPKSPRFGRHATKAQLDALTAPPQASVDAVAAWLRAAGINDMALTSSGDMLRGLTTVGRMEALLDTQYFVHRHAGRNLTINRCASATLPPAVAPLVDYVGPSTRFPSHRSPRVVAVGHLVGAAGRRLQASGQTPTTLRALYGVGTTVAKGTKTQQVATGYLGQYASPADLQTFFKAFFPGSTGQTLNFFGPNQPNNPGVEASLDVQYIMAMGGNVNTTFWYTPGYNVIPDNEPYADFLANFTALSDAALPKTLSTSYGDDEYTLDFGYAQRTTADFMKLGARGVSVLFSSGDSGSGCRSNTAFVPTFPAASPYVTAVGATDGRTPSESSASFSQGGFSNYWARTDAPFQTAAVAAYIAAGGLPAQSFWNASGRAFPDVATAGESYNVVIGGRTTRVSGTSCSAPAFAGLISLLNDARDAAGKTSLGYLNNIFYQNAGIFNDITSGSQSGCGSARGFPVRAGWDAVTGLGTPNFPKMLALALSLP